MTVLSSVNSKKLLVCIAVPLAVGGLSALTVLNGFKEYAALDKPIHSPAPWVFPAVWTLLYILMGISSYLVIENSCDGVKKQALTVYAVGLAVNFLWPILFFRLKAYFFSFIWLIVLLVLVIAVTMLFYRSSKTAGFLQIPYILWLCFAGYFNLAVYLLN